jgi:hypothetical protein
MRLSIHLKTTDALVSRNAAFRRQPRNQPRRCCVSAAFRCRKPDASERAETAALDVAIAASNKVRYLVLGRYFNHAPRK